MSVTMPWVNVTDKMLSRLNVECDSHLSLEGELAFPEASGSIASNKLRTTFLELNTLRINSVVCGRRCAVHMARVCSRQRKTTAPRQTTGIMGNYGEW